MTDGKGVLFVPYQDTLGLLGVEDALRICEEVYGMHARGSVVLSSPPSFKLDVAEEFHNHWHVKSVLLKEVPTTGVRLYNYYDDGVRNTVGDLGCTRYIVLSDPHSGEPVAIVDEHWSYAIRSAAAATLACKWLGPRRPSILGLVGIGTMGTNSLRTSGTATVAAVLGMKAPPISTTVPPRFCAARANSITDSRPAGLAVSAMTGVPDTTWPSGPCVASAALQPEAAIELVSMNFSAASRAVAIE